MFECKAVIHAPIDYKTAEENRTIQNRIKGNPTEQNARNQPF